MKRFTRITSFVMALTLAFLCVLVFPAEANAATEGYYTYEVVDGEATITGCDTSISGDITIPSTLGGYPVTAIGVEAFSGCASLTEVKIPDGVTTIYAYAFADCCSLAEIDIPDMVTAIGWRAFTDCISLTEINIPASVTTIGEYAFASCTSLTEINIPASVTTIGLAAFNQCENLAGVHITDLEAWLNIDFAHQHSNPLSYAKKLYLNDQLVEQVRIPKGVTSIGDFAFYNCSSLNYISAPEGVVSVGNCAFYNCTGLTYVSLPESAKSVGERAFYGCTNLTGISLSDSITSIGNGTFYGCTSLTSMDMPKQVTTIGYEAFYNCASLRSIEIPAGLTTIGYEAFLGCTGLSGVYITSMEAWCKINFETYFGNHAGSNPLLYGEKLYLNGDLVEKVEIPEGITELNKLAFINGTSLTEVHIPDGVTSIGERAFYGCTGLTDIRIPQSVSSIGEMAFYDCTGLTNINIPKGVTTIADETFYRCESLTRVTVPDSVTSIGDRAFRGCSSLSEIILLGNTQYIGEFAFCECTNLKSFRIPYGVETIEDATFRGCTSLMEVTIPDSVSYIGERAFYDCSSLAEVNIPNSVTTIETFAFFGCLGLKGVYIEDLAAWCRIDMGPSFANPLFWGKKLYLNNQLVTEMNIPEGIKAVKEKSFFGCGSLTVVTIPNYVTEVGGDAFRFCDNLTAVYMADEVTAIDENAFADCNALSDVYYEGTQEQWDQIAVGEHNEYLLNATIHFDYKMECEVCEFGLWGSVSEGEHQRICVNCGKTETDGHEFDAGVVTDKSTCSHKGEMTYTCLLCGETKTETLPTNDVHSYGNWVEKNDSVHKHICEGCKKEETQTHSWGEGTTHKPTATEQGYTEYACLCGATYRDQYTKLPAPAVSVEGKILRWDPIINADGYEIYRATSKTGKYTKLTTISAVQWMDSAEAKIYYYKVKAVYTADTDKNSSFSNVVSVDYPCATPELTVETGSTGKPVLTWNKITGAKKYEIWRSVDGGTFKKLTTTTKLTCTDSKATAGAECTYKVKALGSKSAYNSDFSNTGSCYVTCAAPGVTLKLDSKTGKPALSWKKITGAVGYAIYRSENDGEYELLTTTTAVSYKDTAAQMDNKYSYYVVTVGKSQVFNSIPSTAKSITLTVKAPKLTGSADAEGKPVISWTAVENAVSYEIYRSTKSSKGYGLLATVETTSYTDTTVATGKTYYYKVVAVGANTESAMSSYLKMSGKCATPVISVQIDEASGKPVISWEKAAGASKYTVYRATSENGKYTSIGTSKTNTYTDSKAVPGTEYYYKVVANGSKSTYNSNYSNVVSAIGYAAQPQVTLKNDSKGKPVVSWKKISEAEKYIVVYVDITDVEDESQLTEQFVLDNLQYVEVSKKTSVTLTDTQTGRLYMVCVVAVPKNEEYSAISQPGFVAATCATPKATGKVGANKKPVISWKEVDGAAGYIVLRSTSKTKGYEIIGAIEEGTSFEDLTAVKGKTYYYKVIAVDYSGFESAEGAAVKVKSK